MADTKISALTSYATPLAADVVPIVDSANGITKQITWANIKAVLKIYFDTLYPSGSGTSTGANTGDQTSIVGITGTTAQFNTALTDGDFATLAGVETMTNKRITPRVDTVASSATPSINVDTTDLFTITALATNITSMTSGLSGTPTTGQKLIIRLLDNGAARAIVWGASWASRGVSLPVQTILGKYMYLGFIWNEVTSTWDCIASSQEV